MMTQAAVPSNQVTGQLNHAQYLLVAPHVLAVALRRAAEAPGPGPRRPAPRPLAGGGGLSEAVCLSQPAAVTV